MGEIRSWGGFKLFWMDCGEKSSDRYAGIVIIISKELLDGSRNYKLRMVEHRVLGIRVVNNKFDFTVLGGICSGGHGDIPREGCVLGWVGEGSGKPAT